MKPRTTPRTPPIVAARNRPTGRGSRYQSAASRNPLRVTDMRGRLSITTRSRSTLAPRARVSEPPESPGVSIASTVSSVDVAELGVRPDGQRVVTVVDEVDVLGATRLAVVDAAPIPDRDDAAAGEQHDGRRQPACRRAARHESDGEQPGGLGVGDGEGRAGLGLPQPLHDERPDADRGGQGRGEREQRQQGGAEAAATRGCRERLGAGAGPGPGARAGIRQIDDDLTQR